MTAPEPDDTIVNGIMDHVDRCTPDVDGLTRTEIVVLAAASFLNGAAAALDLATAVPGFPAHLAERVYSEPKTRAQVATIFENYATEITERGSR